MITQTIREAIMANYTVTPGYVYVVRDSDVIFYVGISKNPPFRLGQHLGIADGWNTYTYPREKFIQGMEKRDLAIITLGSLTGSAVGHCIRDNAPESLEWSFDIYEKKDAIAVVTRAGLTQRLPHLLELMERDWYEQRSMVESHLIEELKPYLNMNKNAHERNLPARYQRMRPETSMDDNAVDYIKL